MAKKSTGPKAKPAPKAKPVRTPETAAPAPASVAPPTPGVTVRMYCQGLGDCFLLTFNLADGAAPVRVLIDCGVLQHTPGEATKMTAVANHIAKDVGGAIDLLVVTHEHWDHVAGFSHAKSVFENLKIKNVWLSWAENLDDADAKAIKADLGKKRNKLQLFTDPANPAHARLQAMAANSPFAAQAQQELQATTQVLQFLGAAPEPHDPKKKKTAAKGPAKMSLGDTMNWLRAKVKKGDWCTPGQIRPLPGAAGVKVYVLGPPRDPDLIRKMDPTGDQGYKLRADRVSLPAALDRLLDGDATDPECPVDEQYRVPHAEAQIDPFFLKHYGFADDGLGDNGEAWRRIDDAWALGGLSRLALQLDTGVNNTSLALAFELPDGRTLIFPGDAQIGNWISWDKVKFKDENGNDLDVTAKDLLNRAVFYKVGHHGSHNATRRVGGLEEMNGNLVAMIPTDEVFAMTQSKPHGWKMPFASLYDDLKKRTNRRILRADKAQDDLAREEAAGRKDSPRRWDEFHPQVVFAKVLVPKDDTDVNKNPQPLYIEYTLPPANA